MIDKLRKKLVAINLISVGVVFFIAILLIFSLGYSRIGEERNTRMASALTYDTTDNNFANEDIYKDMALALYDKITDEIVWYKGCNFNYDVEELDSSVRRIVEHGETRGFARMRLRYQTSGGTDVTRVVFNDLDSSENGLAPYLLFALITLLLGLAIYVVISYMLASMALKPIEESWSKQKQFVADASHELKTPLSVIMANTEIIASHGSETVDSQMRWIENTRGESARMAELVASLLFLAKNDDGLKVELKTVNLSDCVSTTVLGQDAVFYENGKKFDYSLTDDITVFGNETQLKQLVTIL